MSRSNSSAKMRQGSTSTAGGEAEGGRAQWSQQSYSLEDIAQTFTLPLVVRCQATVMTRRDAPLPLNLAHPLLLYSQRTIRKLLARNVLLDPRTHRYTETDETIVIPSDYPGKRRSIVVVSIHRLDDLRAKSSAARAEDGRRLPAVPGSVDGFSQRNKAKINVI